MRIVNDFVCQYNHSAPNLLWFMVLAVQTWIHSNSLPIKKLEEILHE